MAQTSVEWLAEQIKEYDYAPITNTDEYAIVIPVWIFKDKLNQAKAMEKEQMISAMIYTFNQQNTLPYGMEYLSSLDEMINHCENYLKETYGTYE
jgi:hypothetical protein